MDGWRCDPAALRGSRAARAEHCRPARRVRRTGALGPCDRAAAADAMHRAGQLGEAGGRRPAGQMDPPLPTVTDPGTCPFRMPSTARGVAPGYSRATASDRSCRASLQIYGFVNHDPRRSAMSAIANSTVPTGSTEQWRGQEALPVADRAGRAVAGLHRVRRVGGDRLGRLLLDRPGGDPGDRAGDRPDRRARPLQPARRRDRGARAGPLLPLDHLPLPADPVRRVRRRVLPDRARRPARPPGRPEHVREGRPGRSRSAASAGSASTPPTSSATSARTTSAGCPRSRWRRASTATSTSSTTAATTSGSRRRRTRRARGSARTSTSSGRARSGAR